MGNESERGHKMLPHTADETVEAWGPSLTACLEEAVTGLVESFADTTSAEARFERRVELDLSDPDDALVALMEEIIYELDVDAAVPVGVESSSKGTHAEFRLEMASVADVEQVGAIPKAISLSDLVLAKSENEHEWRCRFTVDV